MRLDRMRGGDLLAGVGGAVLLVAMFLPWFGKVSPFCTPLPGHACGHNVDAWEAFGFTDVVLFAAALGGLAVAAIAAGSSKTDAAIASASCAAPIAALATLLVLFNVLDPPGSLDTRYGVFIGLGAAAATTYGCWRAIRNDQPSRVAGRQRRRRRRAAA
jgi:hypothetical protein